MISHTYRQVQQLVKQLSPQDQARLLEYLSSQMASILTLLSHEPSSPLPERTTTWQEFFRVGDEVMNADCPDSNTLTAAVLAMRR